MATIKCGDEKIFVNGAVLVDIDLGDRKKRVSPVINIKFDGAKLFMNDLEVLLPGNVADYYRNKQRFQRALERATHKWVDKKLITLEYIKYRMTRVARHAHSLGWI